MAACVALFRGINVGKTKRIAMAELRAMLEDLGLLRVRTLLNSGNAIFEASRPDPVKIAAAIEAAIRDRFGFGAPTVVVTAEDLRSIVLENPIAVRDPSRFLVAFARDAAALTRIALLGERSWRPEAIAVGRRAAYLRCATSLIESKLFPAVARAAGDAVTTRNWATVTKVLAAASIGRPSRGHDRRRDPVH